jgi:hypothetical protein
MNFNIDVNNHEAEAYNDGYLDNYLSNYLFLKKIIEDNKKNINDTNIKRFFSALNIYSYSLFENLWLAYKASYSNQQLSSFVFDKRQYVLLNQYKSNLPSFSMIILLLGTCRDIYFVLLKLLDYKSGIVDEEIFFSIITNDTSFRNPKREEFKSSIEILSNNNSNFVLDGLKVYDNNILRNLFAHSFRLPWWSNKKAQTSDFFIMRAFYDTFENLKDSNSDRLIFKKMIFDIIDDIDVYQSSIENSSLEDVISATEILRKLHDLLSIFINNSFGYIINMFFPLDSSLRSE